MSNSKYILNKAEKLVKEHRVLQVFWGAMFDIFLVVGRTKSYFVHLRKDETVACTCPYWTYQRKPCSHIMASRLYHNPHRGDMEADPEPEVSMAEIERIVAQMRSL
jgi:predicted nucleic acid-binding Zn finger protein